MKFLIVVGILIGAAHFAAEHKNANMSPAVSPQYGDWIKRNTGKSPSESFMYGFNGSGERQ
jgi:hypothetical protein